MNIAMPKVSVVVPFFKVETYISRCCESLFEQTFEDFELIFVDDCSPDRSSDILRDVEARYAHRRIPVEHVRHDVNRGIAAARKSGMARASGDYLLFVDSDDFLDRNMIEVLYARARDEGADIVYCDYFDFRGGAATRIHQAVPATAPRQIAAAMLRQEINWVPWNKLVRRGLLLENHIDWPVGINMAEDLVVMGQAFCHARRIAHVDRALYFYNRDNVHSLLANWTSASSEQNLEAIQILIEALGPLAGEADLSSGLLNVKLMARYQMLYTLDPQSLSRLLGSFPETDADVTTYRLAPRRWRLAMSWVVARRPLLAPLAVHGLRLMRWIRRHLRF